MFTQIVSKIINNSDFETDSFKSDAFLISDKTIDNIRKGLSSRITNIVSPSLNRFFLKYLNNQDLLDTYLNDNEDVSLDLIRNDFISHSTELIETKVPSLIERIGFTCRQYQEMIKELFIRLEDKYSDISTTLLNGLPFTEISKIETDSGDMHNHGRCTMIIQTDVGSFVYKPHDLSIDAKISEMYSRFFSDISRVPLLVLGDHYGFVEYIENKPATTVEQANKYFYNLGGLTAIIDVLGSSDLHHNNVIASSIYPIIIDYELMFTPGKNIRNSLAYDLEHSLYHSSLLPSRRGDIEMSILFAKDKENRSSPVINDERKCVCDFPDPFFSGFNDIYQRCLTNRDELKEFVSSIKNVEVRHIYRNTRTYADLLKKTLEPGWLNDDRLQSEMFNNLSSAMILNGNDNGNQIARYEREALLRGDIPYFYTLADSCDLYAEGNVVYKDFFNKSCIDNLIERIDYLSDKDLEFEKTLLSKSLNRVVRINDKSDPEVPIIYSEDPVPDDELLKRAEDLFRQIDEDKVITPSSEICWFALDYHLQSGMDLMNNGLINGTLGLAVFFSALYRLSKDPVIKQKCLVLTRSITDKLTGYINGFDSVKRIYPNTENVSFSTGLAGKILGLHIIASNLNDHNILDACHKAVGLISKLDLSYEKLDIYSGLSGLLKVLCRYDDLFELDGVDKLVEDLCERILRSATIDYKGNKIWRTLSTNWAISGAGHGQSGVASALYLAGKRLNRDNLLSAAQKGFDFENEIYSKDLKCWPDMRRNKNATSHITGYCSGAPGIGINALNLKYDVADQIINKAIDSINNEQLLYKDILCCGNSSVVEFFIQAGMYEEARKRMSLMIQRADINGHFNLFNERLRYVYSSSLFYGVTGIAYTMLRILDPENIESVLL